jgi:hypothetical protein
LNKHDHGIQHKAEDTNLKESTGNQEVIDIIQVRNMTIAEMKYLTTHRSSAGVVGKRVTLRNVAEEELL